MPVVEFPYTRYKQHKLPIIPLQVKGDTGWKTLWVFVDSGATYSLFYYKEGERLGLDPRQGKKWQIKVGDGNYISAYLLSLRVKVESIEFTATLGFSEQLGTGFNIMGRKDFFEQFRVCFDDAQGMLQFHSE